MDVRKDQVRVKNRYFIIMFSLVHEMGDAWLLLSACFSGLHALPGILHVLIVSCWLLLR